jgi:hypothetical protein
MNKEIKKITLASSFEPQFFYPEHTVETDGNFIRHAFMVIIFTQTL